LIRYTRPSIRPNPVDATDGQTVITVASATEGGTTPEIVCEFIFSGTVVGVRQGKPRVFQAPE
jgi:hypothetical protein